MIRWRLSVAERQRRRLERLERRRVPAAAQRFSSLCRAYQPQRRFEGQVLLIRSDDDMGLPPEDRRGWTRDVTGDVREVYVSCSHDEIGTDLFISEVATAMRAALEMRPI
jgi:hypothetical protein